MRLPANNAYAKLCTASLGLQGLQATHNPLIHGSRPCGPTTFKDAHCAAFVFLNSKGEIAGRLHKDGADYAVVMYRCPSNKGAI